jgi:F420-0:gamma-glutamyl ligase
VTDILELARIAREAIEAERELWDRRDGLALDIRVAERDGNQAEVARLKAEEAERLTAWHKVYLDAKDRVGKLCNELGINASDIHRLT